MDPRRKLEQMTDEELEQLLEQPPPVSGTGATGNVTMHVIF